MAGKKQDAVKHSALKPDENEGTNNWVCVSDELYESFLKKLAACSKPKEFKTVICSKQGARAFFLYVPEKKVFFEKSTGRKVQRFELPPGCEIGHMSEVGRALLVGGERFQQVFDRTVTANMMRNGVTGHQWSVLKSLVLQQSAATCMTTHVRQSGIALRMMVMDSMRHTEETHKLHIARK